MSIDIVVSNHALTFGRDSDFGESLDGTTLVTRGLAGLGHPELALVLFRSPKAFPGGEHVDAAVEQLRQFLGSVARAVGDGARLEPGTTLTLNPGLVGIALRGLVWADASPLVLHGSVPAGALVGVPLLADELALAQRTSPYRLLTRIGRNWSEFPFVPWVDPLRASVAYASGEDGTALHHLPRMRCDATFVAELAAPGAPLGVRRLLLEIRAAARGRIAQAFAEMKAPAPFPFAIVGAPSPDADGWMMWEPGQPGPYVVERPHRALARVSGVYLGVVPDGAATTSRAVPREDGYVLVVTAEVWGRLRDALVQGAPLATPMEDGGTFELGWT